MANIKIFVKNVSGTYILEGIEHGETTLYENSSGPQVELGTTVYDFEMDLFENKNDPTFKHKVIVKQEESGTIIKPGGDLPKTSKPVPVKQEQSGSPIKPGGKLPKSQRPVARK